MSLDDIKQDMRMLSSKIDNLAETWSDWRQTMAEKLGRMEADIIQNKKDIDKSFEMHRHCQRQANKNTANIVTWILAVGMIVATIVVPFFR